MIMLGGQSQRKVKIVLA